MTKVVYGIRCKINMVCPNPSHFHSDITLRLAFIRKICFWNLLDNQKIFYSDDNFGDVYVVPKYNTHFPVFAKYASYFSFDKTDIINMTT
jgi:hypothetical protein